MFLTAHTPLSLVIGASITNPFLAFVLGFLGHFALDLIPHDSKKLHLWVKKQPLEKINKVYFLIEVAEFFIIFLLLAVLYLSNKLPLSYGLVAALIGGWLPDVLWGLNNLTQKRIKILNFYHKIHSFADDHFLTKYCLLPIYGEILVQLFFTAVFLFLYLKIV
ncbi:MAG TPA: hypothetical protein PKZ16_02720 [bacterium]|nr:hypothetical protein [bacterium]HPL95250.1 hypothetical protein [bacterium]